MEKVFLGVVAGAADAAVTRAVRAILDFVYYGHFEVQTTESLTRVEAAWKTLHREKNVFVRLGVRNDFNIPKFHSMQHYVHSIRELCSADGDSTEGPERLHIDFAKLGYCASNRKQYVRQMTRWLERQEAVRRFELYLRWCHPILKDRLDVLAALDGDEDDEEDEEDKAQEPAEPENDADDDVDLNDSAERQLEPKYTQLFNPSENPFRRDQRQSEVFEFAECVAQMTLYADCSGM